MVLPTLHPAPPPLPAEAPLEMPVQQLDGNAPASIEVKTRPYGLQVRRRLLIVITMVLSLAASTQLREAFANDGLDAFEIMLLILFVPLFSLISFGFVTSTIGFVTLMSGEHAGFTAVPSPASQLGHRSAVLMPVYNESVEITFARVRAMANSIHAAAGGPWFDFFILSDSSAAHGVEEEAAWRQLAAEAPIPVYYRRREQNTARKPGNIAEWVCRFGAAYECMVVLDADSLMSGDAIVGLASIMEQRPSIGLLQTVPMIINATTLFQRWMQFASHAYGPVASAGLVWWSGSEANFWGHNAIVRTRAFAESCGLPELPGKPPFGGHIQSHDIVESALLRRRGWAVHMVMIEGSYEEMPPTFIDYAIRDRRWMQGNLQNLRLILAPGLSSTNRSHLAMGVAAYLASPTWLLLLLISIARAVISPDDGFTGTISTEVLAVTLVVLFAPKVMGTIWILSKADRRRSFGGVGATLRSVALEVVLSILFAPIMMMAQSKALFSILLGKRSGWNAQDREARQLKLREVLPFLREHIALGVLFAATFLVNRVIAIWLCPITIGLLASPWLVSLTSSPRISARIAGMGILKVPPPEAGFSATVAN
jgi:membrane glycosyltransferase